MSYSTAVSFLKFAGVVCGLFGAVMVASLVTPLSVLMDFFVDLAHFPVDGQQSVRSGTERLMTAITGGLLAGLAVFVWQIAEHMYKNDPALGGRVLTMGLLAWYIPDSIGSVAAGAAFNVVLNTGFLALFLVPVFLARKGGR